jgi:hypothetical protein
LIDSQQPGTPGWRLDRLVKKLAELRPEYQRLDDYYTGVAACPQLATARAREAFRRLMSISRTNYAELVVEAVRERLKPVGFRTGADGDENGDSEAWRIWQANQLDADAAIVHRWALTMRDAYCIVGPVDPEIGAPLISIEDPRYMTVEYDPARRRKVTAAVKLVCNPDLGLDVAYLYLLQNGRAWVLRAARSAGTHEFASIDGMEWVDEQRLPFDTIPVVGFHNQMSDRSWGEFEKHIATLDRINYGILNRLEIATLQAFKQRALKGGPTHDPVTGEEVDYADIFAAGAGAIWKLPDGADMWESGQVDLGPLQKSIRDDVQDLAASTRTPLFYLTPDAANGSAEGASLAREGLVFKAEDRQTEFGESWEQVESLAFLYQGDQQRASRGDMEVIWAPVERFSLAEKYDAASKAGPAGVPWRTTMEQVLGYSPQQVDRMEAERTADALLSPETAPAVTGFPPGSSTTTVPVPVGG